MRMDSRGYISSFQHWSWLALVRHVSNIHLKSVYNLRFSFFLSMLSHRFPALVLESCTIFVFSLLPAHLLQLVSQLAAHAKLK